MVYRSKETSNCQEKHLDVKYMHIFLYLQSLHETVDYFEEDLNDWLWWEGKNIFIFIGLEWSEECFIQSSG